MKIRSLLRIGSMIAGVLFPLSALADYSLVNDTVSAIGGFLPSLNTYTADSGLCDFVDGTCGFAAIAGAILVRFRPLLTVAAVMAITIAGLRMVIAQEDEALQNARKIIAACVAGIVLAYLVEPFLRAFYGSGGEVARGGMAQGAAVLDTEVMGLINWALTIAGALAVTMMILAALKSFQSATSEEGITALRKSVISIVIGVLLLTLREILGASVIVGEVARPEGLLYTAAMFVAYILTFFCLVAVCVLVYAGFQLVLSWGNDEAYTKAKSILRRMIFGTMLLLLSLAIVMFVVVPGLT